MFKVGERVEFDIVGTPKSIDFYSGEKGSQYGNKKAKPSGISLNFRLNTSVPDSREHFFLLVSTDFDGDYSSFSSVQKATWIDVTNRVSFPQKANTYADAGPIDLSDLAVVGKPFYFAIKYVNVLGADGNPVQWYVRIPQWHSLLPARQELIGAMTLEENSIGFRVLHENTKTRALVSAKEASNVTDRFSITGHKSGANTQTWIVSKGFSGIEEVPGSVDMGLNIKSLDNPSISDYHHVYTMPGSYNACFVAIVVDENGQEREEVREVKLVIEE